MICNTGKIIDPNEIEGEPDFIDLLVVKNTKSKKKTGRQIHHQRQNRYE